VFEKAIAVEDLYCQAYYVATIRRSSFLRPILMTFHPLLQILRNTGEVTDCKINVDENCHEDRKSGRSTLLKVRQENGTQRFHEER
jgi:hypothetical protein